MTSTAGPSDRRSVAFPGGAALVGDDGSWVLADAQPARALGPALAVARSAGATGQLNLLVEDAAGLLARRASQFAAPPVIWLVDGRSIAPVEAEPLVPDPALDPRVAPFADVLTAAGADPVVEHGRLIGEVEGLEVARVVVEADGPHLEVGVGRFDREAHALVSSDRPTAETLAGVVTYVRSLRRHDGEPHPLKQLAADRWLRSRLLHEPGLVGADHLAPLAPTVEAPDLRTPWPSPATGIDTEGRPIVVVASVGVDLDLVPAAADARLADGRGARLVLAMAERDAHPVTRALAAALADPAEIAFV
ncbi:MAG: hypothetical protein JWO68_799 [Actinomycetia bacterium]|nr:hypothetical protein [Actinomycetes bacterium]